MSAAALEGRLERLHARVMALGPWRAAGLAVLLGALGMAAHPPLNIWPALIVSLTGLVWLLDGAAAKPNPARAGAWRAWAFALGYFAAGLWWVANAFIARGPEFYPLIPFAVTLLPAGLALFWAVAGAVCGALWPKDWARIALFAGVFFIAEYLRGHILTGFPWHLPGMVWNAGGPVAQSAAWIGLYGLSLLTLFAFAAPAALAGPGPRGVARAAPLMAGFAIFAVLFGAGIGRLAGADPALTDTRVRLVQAAIPQDEKWMAENRASVAQRYMDLTAAPDLDHVDLVIWPEAALPILFPDNYGAALAELSGLLEGRAALATGVYRTGPSEEDYRNALAVLDFSTGVPRLAGLYDKVKLVPFGEFTPMEGVLGRLGVRVPNIGGFAAGEEAVVLDTALAPPFAPLICYEIIFPRFVPYDGARPEWMLNVSNDAWFGASAGPLQHFAQARFRAIEEGLPVIRAASGGVSGAIDAWGRERGVLSPDRQGYLDLSLPAPGPRTFYSKYGDLASGLLLLGLTLVVLGGRAIWPRNALTKRRN